MAGTRWIDELVAGGPILTDGAWGTQLQQRGLDLGELPDTWNLRHPDRVEEVARAYVEAGSRIILTNTFRANRIAFGTHRDADRIAEINCAGVEISRRAAGSAARVFASMGPSGKQLITGDVGEAQLAAAFAEQATAQAEAGADAIVVETMADLREAQLAVEAALATGLPVVGCMVFDSGRDKDRTMMGVDPERAATALTAWGVHVVGANCGSGVESYVPICNRLAAATDRPVWIKPNAGMPRLVQGEVVYDTTAEQFAGFLPALVDAGARFVGGCCGTDPGFIAALGERLKR
ncbi:MAG: homocysteine S-methyltransferase family protein [Deltaproteobacteria bacterium]|nr:MAG: homocysteine S-methyltransferase family protein [Deltaproteobacteria bacterium]